MANASTALQVRAANDRFHRDNYGKGFIRTASAVAVKHFYPFSMPANKNTTRGGNLRGSSKPAPSQAMVVYQPSQKQKQKQKQPQKQKKSAPRATLTMAPVSIGTTLHSTEPSVKYHGNSVHLTDRSFLMNVGDTTQTNWFLGNLIPLNPLYWDGLTVGRLCGSYTKFRWKKLVIHFVTRQPTTAAGEILMMLNNKASNEALSSANSAFLPRAMAKPSALMGPIWTNHSLQLKVPNRWCDVDCMSTGDFDDNLPGELFVYIQSAFTDTIGYLIADYEIEFTQPDYNTRTTSIPVSPGFSNYVVTPDSTAPGTGNFYVVTLPTVYQLALDGYLGIDCIYKVVVDVTGSTFTAPITAATALRVSSASSSQVLPVVDGVTFYGRRITTTTLQLYPTMESAISGSTQTTMQYNTAGATSTQWAMTMYPVQWSTYFKT